jgi:hypothetical protein
VSAKVSALRGAPDSPAQLPAIEGDDDLNDRPADIITLTHERNN